MMSDFYKGCGAYMRILTHIASAKNLVEASKYARAASAHRENCHECQAMNKPLVEQLFQGNVVIVEES